MKTIIEKEKTFKKFFIYVSFSLTAVILAFFSYLFYRDYTFVNQQELDRARSDFYSIVLARKWNSTHGGVFVEKKEGVESNPYLINPDIYTTDGKTYTKKNPALMSREISELAEKEGAYKFHLTSLNPLNPANIPDKFERIALEQFEADRNLKEKYVKYKDIEGNWEYRYIAPLITDKTCLRCHEHQGYEEGDIRGGISVSFNVTELETTYINNTIWLTVFLFILISTLLYMIYFLATKLLKKLDSYEIQLLKFEQQNAIQAMSVTANHEINQPLTVISGYLEIIKISGTENLSNKQVKSLNNIRKSVIIIANILQKYKNSDKAALGEYVKGISMVKFSQSKIEDEEQDGEDDNNYDDINNIKL